MGPKNTNGFIEGHFFVNLAKKFKNYKFYIKIVAILGSRIG